MTDNPANAVTPTQRLPARRQSEALPTRWHVTWRTGSDFSENFMALRGPTLVVGREDATGATLVLPDPAVSRRHAAFEITREGVRVHDLASSNGTFIDGERKDVAVCGRGSVIRIGGNVLVLCAEDPPEAEAELGMVGQSQPIRALRALIRQIAPSRLSALIIGETGTGKELIARALHDLSLRSGPLVPLNCAAIPVALAESALFGHRRGAFTHAVSDQPGAFRAADKGTLFLDEIGELAPEIQPKLLRALENGEVLAAGANQTIAVDTRIIAATLVELEQAVRVGQFRLDLLGRLQGVRIEAPPLRQRRDDN